MSGMTCPRHFQCKKCPFDGLENETNNSRRFTSHFSPCFQAEDTTARDLLHCGISRSLCRLWVSRVASGRSQRSRHVRYASNSDPIGASQRSVVMCQERSFRTVKIPSGPWQ